MKLFSILLTGRDAPTAEADLPVKMRQNFQSFRDEHPFGEHVLMQDESLRSFMAAHFGKEVVACYDRIIPFAYKADFGRYCLLYEYGGLYSDVSNFFLAPVCKGPPGQFHVFRDNHSDVPWLVSNAIIGAPARSPVFYDAINSICENVRTEFYGRNALCPTGPNLFGAAMARFADASEVDTGQVDVINRGGGFEAFAFLSRVRDVVAVRRKTSPGLASLGIDTGSQGSRNGFYGDYYHARKIYLPGPPIPVSKKPTAAADEFGTIWQTQLEVDRQKRALAAQRKPLVALPAKPQPRAMSWRRLGRIVGGLRRGDPEYWNVLRQTVSRPTL